MASMVTRDLDPVSSLFCQIEHITLIILIQKLLGKLNQYFHILKSRLKERLKNRVCTFSGNFIEVPQYPDPTSFKELSHMATQMSKRGNDKVIL